MENIFRFVLIGSGSISNTYIKAIEKLPNIKVVGVVSRSGKRPTAFHEDHKIEIEDTLDKIKTGYDAVIICTPNGFHHQSAIEAASLGKHVLTEKPLDISIEAMDKMINTCKKNKVKLGVAYQRRMSPDNIVIKKIITENKLGRVFAADLTVKNYRSDDYYNSSDYRGTFIIDGGGPFIQQASHNIDLYAWFFGKPKKIVSDYDTFVHDIEVEDHGVALLRYANGMIGTIIASTAAKPGFDPRLEVHAERGTFVMENDIITYWNVDGMANPTQSEGKLIQSGASSAVVSNTTNHEAIVKDFVESVRENREPFISGESAKIATEIVLEIYKNKI